MNSVFFLFFSLLLFSFSSYCSCLIHHLVIHNDYRDLYEIETFGFRVGGMVNITLHDFSLSSSSSSSSSEKIIENDYKIGFILRLSQNEMDGLKDLDQISAQHLCIFDDLRESDLVLDLSNKTNWKKSTLNHVIPPHGAGLYTFIFARCKPMSSNTIVKYRLDAVFQNPGPDYLSAGDSPLPIVYFSLFLLYSIVLILWLWVICYYHPSYTNHIHYLMAAVLTLKCFTLLIDSIRYYYISKTGNGHNSEGWSILYYIFTSLKGFTLFLVIALIGSGWSFIKPFLASREKNIIWAVLTLQVMNNVAMIVIEETSPGSIGWFNWRDVLHIVDILCCVAILYPIFWSIHHLRQAALVDGKMNENLSRLQLFRQFYVMVLCYIYFTRVIVYLLTASVPFYMQWLGEFSSELGTLLFFVITGYKFQPVQDSQYSKVSTEDEEGREYGLTDDQKTPSVGNSKLNIRGILELENDDP